MPTARRRSLWAIAAAVALLWPDRISGPFDGVPLDGVAEALIVGGVFPALWWFHPRFLRTRAARGCIVALIAWRIASTLLFVQDGWCVRFEPAHPFAKDAGRAPHAWDLRADWRAADPSCSAIMTRSYRSFAEFPAWFFNLPPPSDSWPEPADLPPLARTAMRVRGYLTTPAAGTISFEGAPGVSGWASVDEQRLPDATRAAAVGAGTHSIAIDAELTGSQWALVTRWNGRDLWRTVTATVQPPSAIDLAVRRWARWIPALAIVVLLSLWIGSAVAAIGNGPALAWMAGASGLVAALAIDGDADASRWAVAALAAAALVPLPRRLQNVRGLYALIAVPWLTFVVVGGLPDIGRFRLYPFGNDHWMYQRFAYRIVLQGYWLEGGATSFYFQPFYRWIVGMLHAAFGDSSVGERYWDGFCLLAGATLSYRIARAAAGFRWGLVAAALPLAVFVLGTGQYLLGFGLSEISSAGLLSMAALCALRSRSGRLLPALAAGVLATLGFFTRLNNGIMAIGVACFAIPLRVPLRALVGPQPWQRLISWRTVFAIEGAIGLGLLFFAWRNWHYSGVFSVFYGTQRYVAAIWQPGMSTAEVLGRLATNLARVLTVNDPPRFDVFALPVLLGAAAAAASLAGIRRLRDLPAAAVAFFCCTIAGSFIVFGFAYAGRFSMHVLPITCALTVCAAARVARPRVRATWMPVAGDSVPVRLATKAHKREK